MRWFGLFFERKICRFAILTLFWPCHEGDKFSWNIKKEDVTKMIMVMIKLKKKGREKNQEKPSLDKWYAPRKAQTPFEHAFACWQNQGDLCTG